MVHIYQESRGVSLAVKLTNFHVYSNGPCAYPYKEMESCRAHSGGCGQELQKKGMSFHKQT